MRRAFTLIELLVVITIIVVLLSLLAPALDQAIYQAELAVCGANMNAVLKGLSVYSMDFKRSYPYRQYVAEGQGDTQSIRPWLLRIGDQGPGGAKASVRDDRVPLKGYVAMKMLVDPLCKKVDLEDPTSWIYSSYALWSGWSYKGQQGMTKVGNRLTWNDAGATPVQSYSVNWLITDADNPNPALSPPWIQTSHPDELGLLQAQGIQGGQKDTSPQSQANGQVGGNETNSKWFGLGLWDRGELEINAGAADGSVARLNDVKTYDDERMGYAPLAPASVLNRGARTGRGGSASVPDFWINVPVQ